MKNLKVAISARQLLNLVTPEVILFHFEAQEERMLSRGRISRRIARPKLRRFAQECYASYKKHVREASSPRELAIVQRTMMQHIAHTKTDFLGAVWQGDRKSTIEHLN